MLEREKYLTLFVDIWVAGLSLVQIINDKLYLIDDQQATAAGR